MAVRNQRPSGRATTAASQRPKSLKRKREVEDIESLQKRVADFETTSPTPPEHFTDLPLSAATQDGLKASHFTALTTIQARSIPASLKGADILGAAKTGSGKTLAFLVPVLENLYRKRWTEFDGLGALILSPTRELAIQIFEVLRKIGRNHTFSAGLVIGGKSLQEERERLGRMNILVATPGRILQHMDQTSELDIGNLQILVLDEADRIMDMGFKDTVDAIVEHLPPERQTLMFSATQTKKVSDLARLSLSEPEFVSVHEKSESATPAGLEQNYVVTPLPEKLDVLWSFIRANVKKKILVFLSSGKQVRYVYEAFRHLQPGVSLLHLHGRQKQTARLDITTKFSNSQYACLFATDVAARGLDFPAVDWVVQVDCPEDADTYIHRVGRTARYEREGRAIILLDPSEEEGMLKALERRRVSLEKINVRQKKMQNTIRNQMQNMAFKDPELKYLGQKAFVSYVRSVHVQKDKDIFDLKKLDLEDYAASLGLPGAPKVKFVKGDDAKARKNMPRQLREMSSGSGDEDGIVQKDKAAIRTKYDRMFERQNQDVFAPHYAKMIEEEGNNGRPGNGTNGADEADEVNGNDGFLSVKRRFAAGDEALGNTSESDTSSNNADESGDEESEEEEEQQPTSKPPSSLTSKPSKTKTKTIQLASSSDPLIIDSNRRAKLLRSKKALLKYRGHGSHLHFGDDEDATPYKKEYYEDEVEFKKKGDAEVQREKFLEEERERAERADVVDKEVARAKRREKMARRKDREREDGLGDGEEGDQDGDGDEDVGVQLVPFDEEAEGGTMLSGGEESKTKSKKTKRPKKWFEDASSGDDEVGQDGKQIKKSKKRRQRASEVARQPQTLEDLEAMASGLLAR